MNKTKVIATVGPATSSLDMIRQMAVNGVDVIRINMSHANIDFAKEVIEKVNKINDELNLCVATMLDLKGPLIRIGKFTNGQAFLKKNDKIRILMNQEIGDCTKFSVDYPELINDVKIDSIFKIDDGKIELELIEKGTNYILCRVIKEGIISDYKSLNVPGTRLNRPFLSEEDKNVIKFAHEANVDFLSLSFASCAEDVLEVNDLLINLGNDHLQILTKIENDLAIDDVDNIIKISDGIIVARGDLGVEVSIDRIPGLQKRILNKCHKAGVVGIVATELLSTMTDVGHPTRAEVSDVANAVLDGADAMMLCGETTVGKYPIETIKLLERVIRSAEVDINYAGMMEQAIKTEKKDTTGTIAYSVAGCSNMLQCKAIFAPTISGYTAKKISRFRPVCPIIAISPSKATVKSLALHFGVYPVLVDELKTIDAIIEKSKKLAKKALNLENGDTIIITGGYPFKEVKHTNFMKIEEI